MAVGTIVKAGFVSLATGLGAIIGISAGSSMYEHGATALKKPWTDKGRAEKAALDVAEKAEEEAEEVARITRRANANIGAFMAQIGAMNPGVVKALTAGKKHRARRTAKRVSPAVKRTKQAA